MRIPIWAAVWLLTFTLAARAATPSTLPTIFVCGDSTAKNTATAENGKPLAGWGSQIGQFFDPAKVQINNVAHAGQSSMSYYTRDWPNVLPKIQSGDYVLLVFGINDGGTPPGMGEETQTAHDGRVKHTYGWYMSKMATDARDKGAHVYLLTVTTRNIWTNPKVKFRDATPIGDLPADYEPKADRIERGTGGGKFTQWTKDIGVKLHIPVFDLTNYCADAYEKMGREEVNKLYNDHNHTYEAGAEKVAAAIVSGLKTFHESPFLAMLSEKGRSLPAAEEKYVSDNSAATTEPLGK
jgi:lysophospholipase L1-like esterase